MVELRKTFKIVGDKIVSIRPAVGKDAGRIIRCINRVGAEKIYIVIEKFNHSIEWEENYIENIDPRNILYLVAEIDDDIIGMLSVERDMYSKTYHTGTLGMIILKNYRNIGLGSELIRLSIEWAKDNNLKKICLSCFSTNSAAIALYKKFGFKEEGRRTGQFKIGEKYVDEVMMGLWV